MKDKTERGVKQVELESDKTQTFVNITGYPTTIKLQARLLRCSRSGKLLFLRPLRLNSLSIAGVIEDIPTEP